MRIDKTLNLLFNYLHKVIVREYYVSNNSLYARKFRIIRNTLHIAIQDAKIKFIFIQGITP